MRILDHLLNLSNMSLPETSYTRSANTDIDSLNYYLGTTPLFYRKASSYLPPSRFA